MKTREIGNILNILSVYHKASEDEIRAGLVWYPTELEHVWGRVRDLAQHGQIARRFRNKRLTRRKVAGVLAALSPNKTWTRNVRLCEQFLRTGDAGTYKNQVVKAERIMQGDDPLNVLVGPKERAFYQCFVGFRDTDAVTVDGHAYSIWRGQHIFTSKVKVTNRDSRMAAADYRKAAEVVGLKPWQLQAITWLAHRRIHVSRGHVWDKNRG